MNQTRMNDLIEIGRVIAQDIVREHKHVSMVLLQE